MRDEGNYHFKPSWFFTCTYSHFSPVTTSVFAEMSQVYIHWQAHGEQVFCVRQCQEADFINQLIQADVHEERGYQRGHLLKLNAALNSD